MHGIDIGVLGMPRKWRGMVGQKFLKGMVGHILHRELCLKIRRDFSGEKTSLWTRKMSEIKEQRYLVNKTELGRLK